MKNLFVPYETAKELKEKGFKESCFAYRQKSAVIGDNTILPIQYVKPNKAHNWNDYSTEVPYFSIPLYQQVIDWFREKHNIDIFCQRDWVGLNCLGYCANIEDEDGIIETETYDTYYEALIKAIEEALKLI